MTKRRVIVALVFAMLAVATLVRAQETPPPPKSHAVPEFTPYVFLGSGSSSGVGAAVRWPLRARLSAELETSYRWAEVGAVSSNLSLLFDFPEFARVTPYVAAGIGLDQYGFAERSPAGNILAQAGTAFSVNAGGGVRVRGDENWGIRADARWINGVGEKAPERWRLYNGVTFGR
jgi:hypothetical protein